MFDTNPHAEVERVIAESLGGNQDREIPISTAVLAAIRAALSATAGSRRTKWAPPLRAEVTPSGVCVSRGRCDCAPRLVVAPEASGAR